jgi:hypothetical protein
VRRYDLEYINTETDRQAMEETANGDWVRYSDHVARVAELEALVEAAYFEGALTGWQSATPNDSEIRPAWLESDARAALARWKEANHAE